MLAILTWHRAILHVALGQQWYFLAWHYVNTCNIHVVTGQFFTWQLAKLVLLDVELQYSCGHRAILQVALGQLWYFLPWQDQR
jgi:hypothetical protein